MNEKETDRVAKLRHCRDDVVEALEVTATEHRAKRHKEPDSGVLESH
jgi:hypothetical protein